MKIEKIICEDYAIVKIFGTLSVENIHGFELVLNELVLKKINIIIDFSESKFIDSSSLGMIVIFFSKFERIGKQLILTNINNDIFQMFSLTGIGRRVPILIDNATAINLILNQKSD